jgi:hypothetical protein
VESAVRADPASADCRFVNQLHSQPRFYSFGWLSCPAT